MFKRILVPTDGSTHAEKAAQLGADLAQKYAAELLFLSVVEAGKLTPAAHKLAREKGMDLSALIATPQMAVQAPEAAPVIPESENTLVTSRLQVELAERLVADAEARARAAGVRDVSGLTRDGRIAEAILDVADEHDIDLIVMGSRGLGSLKGLLVGSVSAKVSHLAPCTCVSVK